MTTGVRDGRPARLANHSDWLARVMLVAVKTGVVIRRNFGHASDAAIRKDKGVS